MKIILAICLVFPFLLLAQQDEQAIRKVLSNQVDCWNQGDIDCFMEGYWNSERLVFIGKSGLTYGWNATLENYKKSYPTKDSMGVLAFDIKLIEPISDDFWFVVGKWNLERKTKNRNEISKLRKEWK